MEDASALYAAQCCARRINTVRKAIRLCGADHEQITITALLSSAWGSRCSTLRGDGEAGLHLGVSSTSVLLDGVPLQKPPTNRSFAPRVHFWLAADRIFQGDRLGAWDRLAGQRFAGPAAVSAHRAGAVRAGSFHDLAPAVRIDTTTLGAKAGLRSIVRRDIKKGHLKGKNPTRNW
ncbi:MAG: hypothetical protein ABSD45_17755 [Terriglobia bacterium]|jgi:hypothetical protein